MAAVGHLRSTLAAGGGPTTAAGGVRDENEILRLAPEVLEYMEAVGDTRLLFASTVLTLSVPKTLRASQHNMVTSSTGSTPPLALAAIVNCNLLARDREAVFAVGTKSLYILPFERIPVNNVVEFVVHTHCTAPYPVLEMRVATPENARFDERFVALSSDYMLRQVAGVLQLACPYARLTFHANHWIRRHRPRRADRTAGGSDDSGSDDDDGADFFASGSKTLETAGDAQKQKLAAYRKKKGHSDARVARVSSYGPGRYTEAADALSSDLNRMLGEVDRMLEVNDVPSRDVRRPLVLPMDHLDNGQPETAPSDAAAKGNESPGAPMMSRQNSSVLIGAANANAHQQQQPQPGSSAAGRPRSKSITPHPQRVRRGAFYQPGGSPAVQSSVSGSSPPVSPSGRGRVASGSSPPKSPEVPANVASNATAIDSSRRDRGVVRPTNRPRRSFTAQSSDAWATDALPGGGGGAPALDGPPPPGSVGTRRHGGLA